MDISKIGKALLPIGALALSAVASVMSNKANERQMEETITKKVAEALANQTKES